MGAQASRLHVCEARESFAQIARFMLNAFFALRARQARRLRSQALRVATLASKCPRAKHQRAAEARLTTEN
jgi:hypothetical protein